MSADETQLDRPQWSALTTTHARFALANDLARRYRPEIAPLSAVREVSDESVQALGALTEPGGVVGLFDAEPVRGSKNLTAFGHKPIEQMVYEGGTAAPAHGSYVHLTPADVPDMMSLAELTKPGPFAVRTIALGSYIGLRDGGRLVAMAGERMRFPGFTEISAVCVHPDHRRRGLSSLLVRAMIRAILDRGETPFLHLYGDNTSAFSLYKKLGFSHRRSMTVTFLRRPH